MLNDKERIIDRVLISTINEKEIDVSHIYFTYRKEIKFSIVLSIIRRQRLKL